MAIHSVTIGATSTEIVPENSRRQKIVLCNNSNEDMYVAMGPTAISLYGLPLVANGGSWEDMIDATGYIYKGTYTGICASGGKVLSVTEISK